MISHDAALTGRELVLTPEIGVADTGVSTAPIPGRGVIFPVLVPDSIMREVNSRNLSH